ncbi:tyrosine-type recombinase/integrase (plasmid) [Crocosphaera watsonii WH 8501]|uniref:Phage integrase n=2 Tax=Crocosphaera watsonii TaxID=263511 RepID=Q4BUP5_CROWT|nr:site-specific integrase [Crocosphaera watsonii]EAM47627.1 Phage integrase [Crocosphaera watsonii WH 8501]CCQ49212.1 Phage integrase [Crocosphaera watsonii WH 8502]
MKVNRYGRAEILTPDEISLLFTEGLTKPRDRALFGVCLYAAARINEACTLFYADVIGFKGVRDKLVIRSFNTKGKQDTREIDIHPRLKVYLEEYKDSAPSLNKYNPHLFPGRHGRGHIHKGSADLILREACRRLELEGVSTHSFRRTALTQMSDAGVPLRHIQAISGHRTLGALERYLGVTDKQKHSAISTLDF